METHAEYQRLLEEHSRLEAEFLELMKKRPVDRAEHEAFVKRIDEHRIRLQQLKRKLST